MGQKVTYFTSECNTQASATPNPHHHYICIYLHISLCVNIPKPSNEKQLNLALQAMQRDLFLSIKRAALIYTIDYTILSRRKRGTLLHHDYKSNIQKFINLEENIIIYRVLELDA